MRVIWSRALTCVGCGSDVFDTKLYMIYILNDVVHHCKMAEYANKKTCECSCWNDSITEQERRGELYKNDAAQQLSSVAEQARV